MSVLAKARTGEAPRHLKRQPLRRLGLLGAGLTLRLVAELVSDGPAAAAAVAGFGLLLAFVLSNLHLTGTVVIAIGVALNATVITVNGAMPVEPAAAAAAGISDTDAVADVEWRGPRRLAQPGDSLRLLDDRLAVRPLRQVLSIGDLIAAFGLADLGVHLVRRARRAPDARAQAPLP